jgi:hypothetical protein
VAKGQTGLSAVVTSGTVRLGTLNLVPGYNKFSFGGMTTGKIIVEVKNGSTKVVGGTGTKEVSLKANSMTNRAVAEQLALQVVKSASVCNYNYQVVGLTA